MRNKQKIGFSNSDTGNSERLRLPGTLKIPTSVSKPCSKSPGFQLVYKSASSRSRRNPFRLLFLDLVGIPDRHHAESSQICICLQHVGTANEASDRVAPLITSVDVMRGVAGSSIFRFSSHIAFAEIIIVTSLSPIERTTSARRPSIRMLKIFPAS